SGTINLSVRATAHVGSTAVSANGSLAVTVAPVADAPLLAVLPASGLEDQPITLNILGRLQDQDGSETLSYIVSGLPVGASLSAGVLVPGVGYLVQPAQLAGLTVTPPANYSGSFNLTVAATAAEGLGGVATTVATLPVTVAGVADIPTLVALPAAGLANSPIPLVVAPVLNDLDGSEQLSITITGVPSGGVLNHGTLAAIAADGSTSWSLSPGQLVGLTLTPPHNYSGILDLTVRATATETSGGSQASATSHIAVTVAPGLGLPDLGHSDLSVSLGAAIGIEGQALPLNLLTGLSTVALAADVNTVLVSGLPAGATLNHGALQANGSYLLTLADLTGLTLTPPANFSQNFNLAVSFGVGQGAGALTVNGSLAVQMTGMADAPTLLVSNIAGAYHSPIPLTIVGALTDLTGAESLSYVLSGIPNGARLSAGVNNGNGSWTVQPGQLAGLTITPPLSFSGSLPITVTAQSQTADGSMASLSKVLTVTVASEVLPVLTGLLLNPVKGLEDSAITIGTSLVSLNLLGALSITIGGVPAGATLSAGTKNGDGTWTVSQGLLSTLKITPPANDSSDFQLGISVKVLGITTQIGLLNVNVEGVADLPTVTFSAPVGVEDQPLALSIGGVLGDLDGSEVLSFVVKGLPAGASLSAGSYNAATGDWVLSAAQVVGLKLNPPANFSGTLNFQVGGVASELEGNFNLNLRNVSVTIAPVTDTPILTLAKAAGNEDNAIALNIGLALGDKDGSESFTSIQVTGVPAGATLNHGTNLGNGVWSLTMADLSGLTVTPPAHFSGTLTLGVSATAQDGTATPVTVSGNLSVAVAGVADTPSLNVGALTVQSGASVALGINSALIDTSGSEQLSVTIGNLPAGAVLSAGQNNGDGTWTVSAGQLAGLRLTLPQGLSGDVNLSVTALALETQTGSQAHASSTLTLHVQPQMPALHLAALDVTVQEDGVVPLDLRVVTDNAALSGAVTVTVTGVPDGGSLSAGTNLGHGTWSLTAAQLVGLTLRPPANSDADFNLGITARVTGPGGVEGSVGGQVHVTVTAVADMPTLHVSGAVGLSGAGIPLDIQSVLTDLDGSETLHVTVAGLPAGARLSAGTDNHDGSWTLAPADLVNLSLHAPDGSSGGLGLTVTATAREAAGGSAALSANLHVSLSAADGALAGDLLVAGGLNLSLLGGQTVSRAIITLDPLDFHDGDGLYLAGLQLETLPDGRVLIASTNIEVLGGGFDETHHALILSGTADVSVYQSVLRSLSLDAGADSGVRHISIDLYDQAGATIPAGHYDTSWNIDNDGGLGIPLGMLSAPLFDGGAGLDGLGNDGLPLVDPFGHDSGSSTVDVTNDPLHPLDHTGT
ncbi:beta strand repeat-containing protein, partial [Niveispirillum fermenti]|uniref:beta strand repeat-containing protein n=1 Tax=Niveispirillum fermenti TaxID=1233113 RepID=UPI003A88E94C